MKTGLQKIDYGQGNLEFIDSQSDQYVAEAGPIDVKLALTFKIICILNVGTLVSECQF